MRRALRPIAIVLAWSAAGTLHAQQTPAQLDRIVVVGRSASSAASVDVDLLPDAVWTLPGDPLDRTMPLLERFTRAIPGVQASDIQGNAHLAELTYRGFRASSLLGASQELSVYLDGVRINEPFGDVVNWDLVPEHALARIELHDSASPAFGLNTLGGAVALTTFDGRSAPGLHLDAGAGSFGNRQADASFGASGRNWNGYVDAGGFGDDGWRDATQSANRHGFASIGWNRDSTRWDGSVLWARSRLVGNGLVPALSIGADGRLQPDLYAHDRAAVYTSPDDDTHDVLQATTHLHQDLERGLALDAMAYVRRSGRESLGGDVADPDAPTPAVLNGTQLRQRGDGFTAALSSKSGRHDWEAGITTDASRSTFRETAQDADFTADRGTFPVGDAIQQAAFLAGRTLSWAAYATDTWALGTATHATAALRYERTHVHNALATVDDDTGAPRSQNSGFSYASASPALGISHAAGGAIWSASLSRNTRVPTAIELACADPAEPCRLPAGLQSDPFLHQVESRSLEAGVRSPAHAGIDYTVAAYRTDNRDDIVFQSVGGASQRGYFQNVPMTRHQGIDASVGLLLGRTRLQFGYDFLDATYQSDTVLRQGDRDVAVHPGSPIAGLSRHSLKASAQWRGGDLFELAIDAEGFSHRVALGAEENHSASVPAFATVGVSGELRVGNSGLHLVARIANLFDRRYETYAAWGSTVFDAEGTYTGVERDAVFVAPGAPRTVYLGLRLDR